MKRNWDIQRIETESIPAIEQKMYEKVSDATDYVDFYEKRQDMIIKRDPQTFEKTNRVWQFEYLIKHGLKKDQTFLDYGCGPGAAGVYFIEYLDAGKWTGIDISNESIRVAKDLFKRKKLESKKPELVYIPHGDLKPIKGRTFDVIIAQSVFTHLPPDEIIAILTRLRDNFHAGTKFYSSFSCCPKGIIQQKLHNWYYDHEFIHTAASDAGLKVEIYPDWEHPYQCNMPDFAKSTMAVFSL